MQDSLPQKQNNKQNNHQKINKISIVNLKLANGSTYTGELLDGKFQGEGILRYGDNERYEGNFCRGQKNGIGKYYYKGGEYYNGDWVNNKKQGYGTYFYNSNKRYEGEFKNNMKHGKGTIYEDNGNWYSGQFFENQKHNVGKFYDASKNKIFNFVFNKGEQIQCSEEIPLNCFKQQKQIASTQNINQNQYFIEESPKKIVREILSTYVQPQNNTNKSILASEVSNYTSIPLQYEDRISNQLSRKQVNKLPLQKLNCLELKSQNLRNKRIDQWTMEDVCEWLEEISFADYSNEFLNQRVTGFCLLELNQEDLKELNIVTEKDREVLGRQIQFLKMLYKVQCLKDQELKSKQVQFNLEQIKRLSKGQLQKQKKKCQTLQQKQQDQKIRMVKNKTSIEYQQNQNNWQYTSSSSTQSSDQMKQQSNQPKRMRKINIQSNFSIYKENIQQYMSKKRIDINDIIPRDQVTFMKLIGKGSYGQVHLATWMGQNVAVKSYKKKRGFRNRHIAHFLQEAEITYKLLHPNIVLYMGMFVDDNEYAIVMEYLEGGNLFHYLHMEGHKPNVFKIYKICKDIALAMVYLHGKNILHCDLKSSNLLFNENGKIKVSDFGLSQITTPNKQKTRRRHRLGTPQWMAPEIMRGENYQSASDVYSFGIILWELMTCQIPKRNFVQNSIEQIDQQGILNGIKIPEYSNQFLVNLYKLCTQKVSKNRPSFKQIFLMLDESQIALRKIINN